MVGTTVRHSVRAAAIGLLLLGTPLVVSPAASAAPPPAGDLTGDGTIDAWQLNWDQDAYRCTLVITPADTSGTFAGHVYDVDVAPAESGMSCPTLTAEGRVRSDGSSQLFLADADDNTGDTLVTAVRGAAGFALDHAATNTFYPSEIRPQDTDGDGRDDRVLVTAGENTLSYVVAVDGTGHFGAVTVEPIVPSILTAQVEQTTVDYGQSDLLTVMVEGDSSFGGGWDPTGDVLISDNGGSAQSYPLEEGPGESFMSVDLAYTSVGVHTFTIEYPGDDMYLPSSGSVTVTVTATPTVTSLQIPTPVLAGVAEDVTVSVRPDLDDPGAVPPDGIAVLTVDGQVVDSGALISGDADLVLPGLSAGNHRVTASYLPNEEGSAK